MQKPMEKFLKKFREIKHYLPLILLVFIPLYLKFPLFRFNETFVSIRLEDVLIFLFVMLFMIETLFSGRWKILSKDKLILAILLFFFVGAVALISGVYLTKMITFKIGLFHFLRRIELILLLPFGYWAIKSKKNLKLYLTALFFVVLFVNFYAIGQKYLHFPVISTINSELSKGLVYYLGQFDRINSTFSGHYDLAAFSVMVLSFTSAFIFKYIDNKSIRSLISPRNNIGLYLTFFTLIFSFYILVMTAARLSFIAGVVGIFFSFLLLRKGKYILAGLILLLAMFLYPSQLRDRFVSTITVNVLKSWNKYFAVNEEQSRRSLLNIPTLPLSGVRSDTVGADAADIAPGEPTNTTDLGVYRSLEIRTKVEWPRAIRALEKNPLLGTGYSSLGLATDSDLLRSLGEVGILGTSAFFLILYEVTKRLWIQFKKGNGFVKYVTAGTFSMLVAFLVNSIVIDVFEASKVASLFWLFTGLVLGLRKLENIKNESINK